MGGLAEQHAADRWPGCWLHQRRNSSCHAWSRNQRSRSDIGLLSRLVPATSGPGLTLTAAPHAPHPLPAASQPSHPLPAFKEACAFGCCTQCRSARVGFPKMSGRCLPTKNEWQVPPSQPHAISAQPHPPWQKSQSGNEINKGLHTSCKPLSPPCCVLVAAHCLNLVGFGSPEHG